jgi:hypothetical protein
MPKFSTTLAWQQAELLMQPILIRVIDHLGQQLETSAWQGAYQDTLLWAEGTSEETKALVLHLQDKLATATPEEAVEIQASLDALPGPSPGYSLHLQQGDRRVVLDIWQICYQICFRNYSPILNALDQDLVVEVDAHLLDDTGEVDWVSLDSKTKQVIHQIFANLPQS